MSKSNHRSKYYRFGGSRKDPLNLNELIRRKNQSTTSHQIGVNANDRLVEILLQPDIFDPLCLDRYSYSNDQTDAAQRVPHMNKDCFSLYQQLG